MQTRGRLGEETEDKPPVWAVALGIAVLVAIVVLAMRAG
jgi:hypothetical protein